MWDLLAASLLKTAVRAGARHAASSAGQAASAPPSRVPVGFAIARWFLAWGVCLFSGAALTVVGQLLRVAQGRASLGEVALPAVLGALVCGAPGALVLALGARRHARQTRLARLVALTAGAREHAYAALGASLGVNPTAARALAAAALEDGHLLGRLDDARGVLVVEG